MGREHVAAEVAARAAQHGVRVVAVGGGVVFDQQVVTLGGAAGWHGLNVTRGGGNTNKALGFGSSASQQVFTGAQ